MARPLFSRLIRSAVVMALAAAAGCSGGPASTASARQGLASGDAVGRSLFSPAGRAVARGDRSASSGTMATVVIQPE